MTLNLDPPAAARPQTLAFGAVHPSVAELQNKLNAAHLRLLAAGEPGLPYMPLVPDGHFGLRTREAVLAFQRYAFRDPRDHDGLVGPRTWASLDTLLATGAMAQDTLSEVNDHTADLTDAFFVGLRAVGASLGVEPLYLLQTMMAESGIRADAHNPHGDASGLIQFMPATLRGLGWTAGHAAFRQLSAEEQLPYVQRYYRPYAHYGLNSTARLRQATFLPATLSGGSDPDRVLAGRDGPYASAYRANSGLDRRQDGTIRVSDLTAAVERACAGPRWREARARLEQAGGGSVTPPLPVPPTPPTPTPPLPTPPDLPSPARPMLRQGSRGTWVVRAQAQLNQIDAQLRASGQAGLDAAPLRTDGAFGPLTRRAVLSFQRLAFPTPQDHDGVIGPRTWAKLDEWAAGVPNPGLPTPPPVPVPIPVTPPTPIPVPPLPEPPAPPTGNAWAAFRDRLVALALQEYGRWHPGGASRRETDAEMHGVLKDYWMTGPGLSEGAAENAIARRTAWSAAFISWLMRQAGAGQFFRYASAHTVYCAQAKRNRLNNDLNNPFWLYRVAERAPQVGDLICNARQQSGVTFDNVDDGQSRFSHCDLVAEVQPGQLVVYGGNVHDNVDRKTIRTDPQGFLLLDGTQQHYYAVLALRTEASGTPGAPPTPPTPVPTPPVPAPPGLPATPGTARTAAGRLAFEDVPLLSQHQGPGPELILRWNTLPEPVPGAVDVVLHFHGFSRRGAAMNLERDKEPLSGLDFSDPQNPTQPGRTRPTLALLPRGHFYGGNSGQGYNFPDLRQPDQVRALIAWSLEQWSRALHLPSVPSVARLILTAHSGGGAALWPLLDGLQPDEVHVFDAMYPSQLPPQRQSHVLLRRWAERRIQADLSTPDQPPGAMRVIYTASGGTVGHSTALHCALQDALARSPALNQRYRVERSTRDDHNHIPSLFGWQLLRDAASELVPAAQRPRCPGQ